MNEFGKVIIEIEGKEYTLFLNRKGIIAWEKYAKEETIKGQKLAKVYNDLEGQKTFEIKDDTNPLEGLDEVDDVNELNERIYQKLFWIMLYTEHKMSFEDAKELYAKARREYGSQINALCDQMVEDANKDQLEDKDVKKLEALRPTK